MVTINQIAQEAKVSKSTVSRYLNEGYVSKETAKKIEKVIQKYNYTPNEFARNLKAQRSNFTGVIIPRLDSPSVVRMLSGLEKSERECGRLIMMVNSELSIEREIESLYNLQQNKIAAIVLMAVAITDEHVKAINKIKTPVLVLGQKDRRLITLTQDNYFAGRQMALGLNKYGHKKIAYVGVGPHDIEVGVRRKQGVIDGLKESGISTVKEYETTFMVNDSYKLGLEILPKNDETLYICATDNIAIGLIKAANQLGIAIGKQISFAGFGGHDTGEYVYPTLTTVDLHYEKLGILASKCVDIMLKKQPIPETTTIATEMIHRGSVGYYHE